jgi:hypothetical protein
MMMSLKYYPLLGVSKCMRHVFQKLLWDHWQETSHWACQNAQCFSETLVGSLARNFDAGNHKKRVKTLRVLFFIRQ